MLRVAALVAALVAWGIPLAGVDGTDPTAAEVTPLAWVATPSAGTALETLDATPGQPTLLLHRGRTAVAARGNRDQRIRIQAGSVSIAVSDGLVLVDHVDGTCFVVVLVGSALVRGGASQDRGVLLQSRQGIASAADGMLADVLTFERVPRLNDPEPLALQAQATSDQEAWPQDVPLPDLAHTGPTPLPQANPEPSGEPASAVPPEAPATLESPAPVVVVSVAPEEPETSDAVIDAALESQTTALLPYSLTPAWQQRRGRR